MRGNIHAASRYDGGGVQSIDVLVTRQARSQGGASESLGRAIRTSSRPASEHHNRSAEQLTCWPACANNHNRMIVQNARQTYQSPLLSPRPAPLPLGPASLFTFPAAAEAKLEENEEGMLRFLFGLVISGIAQLLLEDVAFMLSSRFNSAINSSFLR